MIFRYAGLLTLTFVVLTACELGDPYFTQPDRMYVTAVAIPGEVRYIGVAYLSAQEGDIVKLVAAEPVEPVEPLHAGMTWYALHLPAPGTDASIGAVDESDPAIASLIPLNGALVNVASDPAFQTEVVVEIRNQDSTRVSFEAVRIFFTVDGQQRSQVFPMGMAVCFDDPAPESCDGVGG